MKPFSKKHVVCALLLLCTLFAVFAACTPAAAEFSYATDLTDGVTLTSSELNFRLSVAYGSQSCEVEISNGGVYATKTEDGYRLYLSKGENEILVTATCGSTKDERIYHVTYRCDFAITTDVEEVPVVNDVLTFTAGATLNDAACAIVVQQNATTLQAESGRYTATLQKGENVFTFTARSGDLTRTETKKIVYEGFNIPTDLTSSTVAEPQKTFLANAVYGQTVCDLSVSVNGNALSPVSGTKYVLEMPQSGVYIVKFVATHGRMSQTKEITVKYTSDPPRFETLSIEDDASYRGNVFSFEVVARDALGGKLDDSLFSFAVDWDADDGTDNFVALDSSDIKLVWSDTEKTSYRIDFTKGAFAGCKGKKFLFRVTAGSFGKSVSRTVSMTYVGASSDGSIGFVSFSMEAFTISKGYLVEPMSVEIFENENFAHVLDRLLKEQGWTYTYTGTLDAGFYLATVTGVSLENNVIAPTLLTQLESKGAQIFTTTLEPKDSGKYTLGEFDFTSGSGWMYSVNNSFPNYGFADYYPQDGDVVRVQFTLAIGSDLGGGYAMGSANANYDAEYPNYGAILKLLTKIKDNDFYGKSENVYYDTLDTIAHWDATTEELTDCIATLNKTYLS